MIVRMLDQPLAQQGDAAPWQAIERDWDGRVLEPAAQFLLVQDPLHLCLLARHDRPALAHPEAGPGDFQAELWRHDVAELFIASPDGKAYLEFNLSPRGAWWAAAFGAPRQARAWSSSAPCVRSTVMPSPASGWQARLDIPLEWLRREIGWSEHSRANVTFILESPDQRFLSAAALPGAQADFHQPAHFAALEFQR